MKPKMSKKQMMMKKKEMMMNGEKSPKRLSCRSK